MYKKNEISNISLIETSLIPLVKDSDGIYPVPKMRCGILPYYIQEDGEIIWGCVKSNRVGPVTIGPAAGIQDIIIIKKEARFILEVGKLIPDLGIDCLNKFIGKQFRDDLREGKEKIYQNIIDLLLENQFNVFIEHPLNTAIHEASEEHGFDLKSNHLLLKSFMQLPIQKFPQGRNEESLCIWLAELETTEGIILKHTEKIERKIKRNFGTLFYEEGCWGTLKIFEKDFKNEKRKFPDSSTDPLDLIQAMLTAFQETIFLLKNSESLIKADLKNLEKVEISDLNFPSRPLSYCQSSFFQRSSPFKEFTNNQRNEENIESAHLNELSTIASSIETNSFI